MLLFCLVSAACARPSFAPPPPRSPRAPRPRCDRRVAWSDDAQAHSGHDLSRRPDPIASGATGPLDAPRSPRNAAGQRDPVVRRRVPAGAHRPPEHLSVPSHPGPPWSVSRSRGGSDRSARRPDAPGAPRLPGRCPGYVRPSIRGTAAGASESLRSVRSSVRRLEVVRPAASFGGCRSPLSPSGCGAEVCPVAVAHHRRAGRGDWNELRASGAATPHGATTVVHLWAGDGARPRPWPSIPLYRWPSVQR